MALVTVEDLSNFMDVDWTDEQQQGAQLVLDGLHGELEFILRRPIEIGTYTETVVVPANQNPYAARPPYSYDATQQGATYLSKNLGLVDVPWDVHLEESPVITITSIVRDRPQGSSKNLVEGVDFIKASWGAYVYNLSENDSLTITYTAGLNLDETKVNFMKLIMLRAAARETQNLHDDVVGLKDLNTRNVAPLDVGFTDMEIEKLQRYRRYRI